MIDITKEYIICSAIWFRDGKNYDMQPKNIESGFVITGKRHHNCYATLQSVFKFVKYGYFGEEAPEKKEILKWFNYLEEREVQGFLTSKDRFVTRQEAYLIASEIGQCKKEECHSFKNIPYLTSEDIY